MGLFNKKKKVQKSNLNVNSFGDPLDHLVDGELPWGWIAHNRTFVDDIQTKQKYFLNEWLIARDKSPKELRSALKSYILFLQETKSICQSKGECHIKWFQSIIADDDYINKRIAEFNDLELNFDQYQKEYEKKQAEQAEIAKKMVEMEPAIIQLLIEKDNILQSDLFNMYEGIEKQAVKEIVYKILKEDKIERTKSGRSFLLHYKP